MKNTLPVVLVFLVLLSGFSQAAEISETIPYEYNSFQENSVEVENGWDMAMLFVILAILILILYKGETTLENLKKMHHKRKKKKSRKK